MATTPSKLFYIHFSTTSLWWILIEKSASDLPKTEILEQLSNRPIEGADSQEGLWGESQCIYERAYRPAIFTIAANCGWWFRSFLCLPKQTCSNSKGLTSPQKLQVLFGGHQKVAETWVLASKMQAQRSDMPAFTQMLLRSCVFCWLLLLVLPQSYSVVLESQTMYTSHFLI